MRTIVRSQRSGVLVSLSPSTADDLALPDRRRQQILAAARRAFARSGFHGASMHQVCAEAQMSPGAVYRYFPSKDAIIEAIAEEEQVAAGACMAPLFGEGDLVERMTRVAMDYMRAARDPETGGLLVEICSESLRNTTVGARFCEIQKGVRLALHTALEEARSRGELAADAEIDVILTMLFAVGDGLMMRLQIERDIELDSVEPYLRRMLSALVGKERRP
jgi:TetR/AcrR family transcriptional regulator, repressor for uid operon